MRNSLKFIGKSATLLAATSLLMATTSIIPAEAVNKAGARCTKVNAKAKIGGDSYVCAKNPTVKNANLTWVWVGCLDSNKLYIDSNARLKTITNSAAKAIAAIDQQISTLKAQASQVEADAKLYDQKAADAKLKQQDALVKAKAAIDDASRVGPTTQAGKSYTSAAEQWTKAARSYEFANKNFLRSAASLREKLNQVDQGEKQKALVQQTLENAKSEVQSTLQNRISACKPGL